MPKRFSPSLKPLKTKGSGMKPLQRKIAAILFPSDFGVPRPIAPKPEVLNIVILDSKAHFFDFLKAYTTWGAVGKWENTVEGNVIIDVEFEDESDDSRGQALKRLLNDYNRKFVKEQLLYFRTYELSESNLG